MGFGSMNGDTIIGSWGGFANSGMMMLLWVVLVIVLITFAVGFISRILQRRSSEESLDNHNKHREEQQD